MDQRTTLPAPAAAPPATLSREDQEFMTKAAQGGMLEMALGREVVNKASSPEVKALGNRMMTDHAKANDELKKIATEKGVVLPTTLDAEHEATLDKMSKLSGPKLDVAYSDDMVEDHEDDVKEFRKASHDIKDPELRDWASKTLPVLESHLAQAKDTKAKTKK